MGVYEDQIMALLTQAGNEYTNAQTLRHTRKQALYTEYMRCLQNDSLLAGYKEQIEQWDKTQAELAKEIFTPGIVVLYDEKYWIVESMSGNNPRGFEVTYPLRRRKYSTNLYISTIRLVSLEDI